MIRAARSAVVMVAWLFLFGCDDDGNKSKTVTKDGVTYTLTADDPGCDDKVMTGTIEGEDGRRGKIKIEWEMAAVAGFISMTVALSGVLLASRPEPLR